MNGAAPGGLSRRLVLAFLASAFACHKAAASGAPMQFSFAREIGDPGMLKALSGEPRLASAERRAAGAALARDLAGFDRRRAQAELSRRIEQDFVEARVDHVRGWILAETEVLCLAHLIAVDGWSDD
ncbi:MAG: hypothetical protein AAGL49_01290 [Pseudomonadota bacterium]